MDASKLLDTLIKAPLWFYLASTISLGLPLLNIPNLVDAGVSSDMKLGSVPVALLFVVSTALLISSALARAGTLLVDWGSSVANSVLWQGKIRALSPPARAILCWMEEHGTDEIYLPSVAAIGELRDRGLLEVEISGGSDWSAYRLSEPLQRQLSRKRREVRQSLRSTPELLQVVQACVRSAHQAADRRI